MDFKNGWSTKRNIIEFSQEVTWRGSSSNTYYFRKIKNRWHFGWLVHSGILYDSHPFATQGEARAAAKEHNDQKLAEVGNVIGKMRALGEQQLRPAAVDYRAKDESGNYIL